ncbi:HAMP domain-containing sensor histidine kinase [Verrucomicrobiaceae bacterium 227]
MGKIRLSLVLMLLTALGVVLAGRHLARRVEVTRTAVDRDLLMTFADELEKEISRFEAQSHADLLVLTTALEKVDTIEGQALVQEFPAARAAYLFHDGRQIKKLTTLGSIGEPSLPDLAIEGGPPPFNAKVAVPLSKQFFKDVRYGTSGWIPSADGAYLFFWSSTLQDRFAAVLLNAQKHAAHLLGEVREATHEYYQPILQSKEWVALDLQNGPLIFGESPPATPGPPSFVHSIDSTSGRFWLRAWNREEVHTDTHWPTLLIATLLALTIALVGWLLYGSQLRAWRESMQRVSFANRVSHELGTPLTNMTLNLELAARSLRTNPEAAGKRLEKVHEEVGRLNRLVTNVLGYSHDTQQEHPTLCCPDQVIEDVLAQFRPALDRRSIEISWQPHAPATGMLDRDALSQIVWNLISNVEKYASSGKWLGLTTALQNGQLIVEIQDHGPGVPSSHRQRIFQAFERIHESTCEGVSGTGLGLTISRDLATSMGGTLQILSSDSGAKFRLTLPFKTA